MEIRPAHMSEVAALAELINYHAERGRMLHRSVAYLYERVRNFSVCQIDQTIVGCCSLEPVWGDLGEVKSLAVKEGCAGRGIGKALLKHALAIAKDIGVKQAFCLSREPGFFEHWGFRQIDRSELPHKVWSDCVSCPSKDDCDEVALIIDM